MRFPVNRTLERMPDATHVLSESIFLSRRLQRRQNHSYVFQFFRFVIANYNHDGLAAMFCDVIRVLICTDSIERAFGTAK